MYKTYQCVFNFKVGEKEIFKLKTENITLRQKKLCTDYICYDQWQWLQQNATLAVNSVGINVMLISGGEICDVVGFYDVSTVSHI